MLTHPSMLATSAGSVASISSFLRTWPFAWVIVVAAYVVLGLLAGVLAHVVIDGFVARDSASQRKLKTAGLEFQDEETLHRRRANRAQALGFAFKALAHVVIFNVCLVEILLFFRINPAAFIAGAGAFGIAIALVTQSIARDLLAGIANILDDKFEVGDIVDFGFASGTVIAIRIRTTTIRDADGVVWHVRNGNINSVGNFSQSFSLAVVDLPVPRSLNLSRVIAAVERAATEFANHERIVDRMLATPEFLGVEKVDQQHVTLRLQIKTRTGDHHKMRREFNQYLLAALAETELPSSAAPLADVVVSGVVPESPEVLAWHND